MEEKKFELGIVFKTKITVDDQYIKGVSTTSDWGHARSDIKGYRLTSKHIDLHDERDIMIQSISREMGANPFIAWLKENYPDLDKVALDDETRAILDNEAFGRDEYARSTHLKNAKRINYALTGGAIAILIAGFFTDEWQWLLFSLACAVPLVITYCYRRYGGLMRITGSKGRAHPAIWGGYIAALAYVMVSYLSRHTLSAAPLYTYMVIVAIVYLTVFFGLARETVRSERSAPVTTSLAVVYFLMFAFFSVGGADCIFDHAQPVTYRVAILGKKQKTGRKGSRSYHMILQQWGPVRTMEDISISSGQYERLEAGDSVTTSLYPGALGMQWYRVEIDPYIPGS